MHNIKEVKNLTDQRGVSAAHLGFLIDIDEKKFRLIGDDREVATMVSSSAAIYDGVKRANSEAPDGCEEMILNVLYDDDLEEVQRIKKCMVVSIRQNGESVHHVEATYNKISVNEYLEAVSNLLKQYEEYCDENHVDIDIFLSQLSSICASYINSGVVRTIEEYKTIIKRTGIADFEKTYKADLSGLCDNRSYAVFMEKQDVYQAFKNMKEEDTESDELFLFKEEPLTERKHIDPEAVKAELFFNGISAYLCGTEESFEKLESFVAKYAGKPAAYSLNKKKCLGLPYVYIKKGKFQNAGTLYMSGCDGCFSL